MGMADERKNKQIAGVSTIVMHGLLFVFFILAVAWRAPDPPYGEIGYVLNFGLDDQGSGDLQPTEPVGTDQQQNTEEAQPEKPQEEVKPAESEPKPVEEQVTSEDETAVPVKETKKDDAPAKPVENKDKTDKTEKKEPPKEEVKPLAVYKPDASKTDGKAGTPGSHGDDKDKAGDKGNPDGQLDAKALYGRPGGGGGGGGGTGLDIDGWIWDEIPQVQPPENESNGRLVFEIKVNEHGEVIDIKTLNRGLSIEMEKRCKREIEKLTFSKTGTNVPSVSTGKITFVVLSK